MDKGFAFVWPRESEYPYLEGPKGEVIYFEVHDYVPYYVLDEVSQTSNPAVSCPGPARLVQDSDVQPVQQEDLESWCCVTMQARKTLHTFLPLNGPDIREVRRRVTKDLHTREILDDRTGFELVWIEKLDKKLPSAPRDIITYVYFKRLPPKGRAATRADVEELYDKDFEEAKHEPMSLHHLLTHLPKHPDCKVCQQAKLQRRPHKKIKLNSRIVVEPQVFGDQVTADHFITLNELSKGN